LFRLITGVLYEDSEKGLSLRGAQVYSPEVILPGEYKEFGDSYPLRGFKTASKISKFFEKPRCVVSCQQCNYGNGFW
jgi:hypothetical protein